MRGELEYRRGFLPRLRDTPTTTAQAIANYQGIIESLQHSLDGCDSLPEAQRDQGPALLERLAEEGYPGARVAYVRSAMSDYSTLDKDELLEDIDEVIRRRDLTRRYLALAVANCEAGIWSARFDLLDVGVLPDDPVTRVAAMQAYYRAAMQAGEQADHLQHMHDTLDAAAKNLDDANRSRALQLGEAEVARCVPSTP